MTVLARVGAKKRDWSSSVVINGDQWPLGHWLGWLGDGVCVCVDFCVWDRDRDITVACFCSQSAKSLNLNSCCWFPSLNIIIPKRKWSSLSEELHHFFQLWQSQVHFWFCCSDLSFSDLFLRFCFANMIKLLVKTNIVFCAVIIIHLIKLYF